MANIYNSLEELIGSTPLLRLNNIEKRLNLEARLYAKLECFNPAGSVKDRAAKWMLDEAEKSGVLKPDSVIIEPTSGNTGIGLALACAVRGYKLVIVMPETMSIERQKIMKAYGAELILTDGKKGMKGAIEKARELSREYPNSFIPDQFENPANKKAHFDTTGPEIYNDTDGEVDFFVAGVGTGGTISGTGKYLKSKKPDVKIIAVEPQKSPVLSGGEASSHAIQGIGAGFIPGVLDKDIIDQIICVTEDNAYEYGRLMGSLEGLLVGISSGAALYAAINIAKLRENNGKTVVVLLPDTGERYLSTDMYK